MTNRDEQVLRQSNRLMAHLAIVIDVVLGRQGKRIIGLFHRVSIQQKLVDI